MFDSKMFLDLFPYFPQTSFFNEVLFVIKYSPLSENDFIVP